MTEASIGLGIDIGGTGVKAAVVDLASGSLVSERIRVRTPTPSTPEAVLDVVADVVRRLEAQVDLADDVPVGCGLPGVIVDGRLVTAANIDPGWMGVAADELVGGRIGRRVQALNDADAAGIAEMTFGVGRGRRGTVLLLTVGTGIGSALFRDGLLVPNTELGHLELNGREAEKRLSGAARQRRNLKWRAWATEFNVYLGRLEAYLWPDAIIIGGGVSKAFAEYGDRLETRAPILVAEYLNAAGIVGAALYAAAPRRAMGTALRRDGGPAAAELEPVLSGNGR